MLCLKGLSRRPESWSLDKQSILHRGGFNTLQVAAIPFQWEVFSATPGGRSAFYSNFAMKLTALHNVSNLDTAHRPESSMRASTAQAGGCPQGEGNGSA